MAVDIDGTAAYSGGAYQKPSDDDSGNEVFSILEDFMTRMATHQHTGTDSKNISANLSKKKRVLVPSWSADTTIGAYGIYKAVIVCGTHATDELDTSATIVPADPDSYIPSFTWDYRVALGDSKYYWQPFVPDLSVSTNGVSITIYSNVQYAKIRVNQF